MGHPAIPKERWAEVQRRLDAIERDQNCRVLFAGGVGQSRPGRDRQDHRSPGDGQEPDPGMGSGPRIPALDRLIAAEIAAAAGSAADMPGRPPADLEAADRLFRRLIRS